MPDDSNRPNAAPETCAERQRSSTTVDFGTAPTNSRSESIIVTPGLLEADEPLPFGSGDILDNKYLLREMIGQGGMGTVWRAEQLTPLKRLVAVKLLRHDLGSPCGLPRFAIEKQVLASLSHPNIASVFDGGMVGNQVPYLVMELVEGAALHTFCDRERLTIAERLRLVVRVCSAIEHAHQRGIIHRDLKPSNILVTAAEGMPQPKVIDFGLAKALPWSACGTDAAGTELSDATVGTPLYMAPEQIASPDTGIDTRTDVYAIGVILYELVTGDMPFTLPLDLASGWLQTLQTIVHDEPQRPSHRVLGSKDEAAKAAARRLRAGDLSRAIRGDLDWVILKAIAKDPAARYQSVAALRKDIQRLLSKHPIHARPATLAYRANRFFCRHRLLVCLAFLLGVTLAGGLAATSWALVRAHAAEAAARAALAKEHDTNARTRRAITKLATSLSNDPLDGSGGAVGFRELAAIHDIVSDEDSTHEHASHLPDGTPVSNGIVQSCVTMLDLLEHLHHERPVANYSVLAADLRSRIAQAAREKK